MVLWKQIRHINLSLPEELLADVDEATRVCYMSRSQYIRVVLHRAIIEGQAKQQPKHIDKNTPIEKWYLDMDDS